MWTNIPIDKDNNRITLITELGLVLIVENISTRVHPDLNYCFSARSYRCSGRPVILVSIQTGDNRQLISTAVALKTIILHRFGPPILIYNR